MDSRHSFCCSPCSAFEMEGGMSMSRAKMIIFSGSSRSSRMFSCESMSRTVDVSIYMTCVGCRRKNSLSRMVCNNRILCCRVMSACLSCACFCSC